MGKWRTAAVAVVALSVGAATTATAEPVADFYSGKKITVIVGSDAGGGYDTIARLMSRHLGRFIPGNPALVVQNMPGAGSFVATNNLYNLAPKDGTAIGLVQRTILSANATHQNGARFDVRKFNWIGNLANEISLFLSWHTAPVKTASDMFTKEFIMGGGGPTSDSEVQARMLNALIGTKIKIVSGYPGQAQILLAMERGEIQGMGGWGYTNLQMHIDLLKEKKINLLLQGALERIPQLPDLPTPFEFAKREDDRKVLALFYSQQTVGRPVLAPPDVPADRLSALRTAFMQMAADSQFQQDAKKTHIDADPTPHESIEKVVETISSTPPKIVERFAKLNAPPDKL
jgi:tripartite-type tricarboxylate transporter receptor subunit TctC